MQVLNSDYLPLTEKLAQEAQSQLHNIEVAYNRDFPLLSTVLLGVIQMGVEAHTTQTQSWFQDILQYGMGAAQLWRDASTALAEARRSREEALERLRVDHDVRNQNGEANLDLVLDHMRQAPNEQVIYKTNDVIPMS